MKQLIYEDKIKIGNDLRILEQINMHLKKLKDEFSRLPLKLTKVHFFQLLQEGAEPIIIAFFNELVKKSNLPEHVLNKILNEHNLRSYQAPLDSLKDKILEAFGILGLSHECISWQGEDSPTIRQENVSEQIAESNRIYANEGEEQELLQAINQFCENANKLEEIAVKSGGPPIFLGQFFEIWYYATTSEDENPKMIVDPGVFYRLRKEKARQKRQVKVD